MSEKLVRDGSENRRALYNVISLALGAFLLFAGFSLLFIKFLSVEHIDSMGILHENFFLIPIACIFLLAGFITFLIADIRNVINVITNKDQENKVNRITAIVISSMVIVDFLIFSMLMLISFS